MHFQADVFVLVGRGRRQCIDSLSRLAISAESTDKMTDRVIKGYCDDDLSAISADLDDDIDEHDPKSMDAHLLANYGIVSDALEFEKDKGKQDDSATGSAAASSASLTDAEWFLAEMKHDIVKFKKLKSEAEQAASRLAELESDYEKKSATNVDHATKGFAERYADIIQHKSDEATIRADLVLYMENKVYGF